MRLAFVLACAVSMSACGDAFVAGDAPFVQPDLSGSLRIPLSVDGTDGVSFRLRDAHFELSGSALLSLSERENTRREAMVTRLPPGEYTVFLRPGWRLVQRDGQGAELAASAELLTPNPTRLVVNELGDESLHLIFQQGDQQIRFGAGPVQVTQAELPPHRSAL
jgi:hypothetical protein